MPFCINFYCQRVIPKLILGFIFGIFLGLFYIPAALFADSEVRSFSVTDPLVYASNVLTSYQSMVAVPPTSGSGEQEANPFTAFIPLGSGVTQEQCTSATSGSLLPKAVSAGDGFIKITLRLTNDSGINQKLFAAVKDGANFEAFTLTSTTTISSASNTVTQFDVIFSLANLCANHSTTCTTISTTTAAGSREAEHLVHFFLVGSTAGQPNAGDVITTTDDGLFYKIKVSDKMPTGVYRVLELRKGDARLTAVLADGDLVTQMGSNLHKTMVYSVTSGLGGVCPAAAAGSMRSLDAPVLNGDVAIRNLTNGTAVTLAFALVNKFQFTTFLSDVETETPESIAELLTKNSCFLLTAGFEGDHPTILFFREFRDQVLLGSTWGNHIGKALVAVYYAYGPDLALKILDPSPNYAFLRKTVRSTANLTKSMMQIFWTPEGDD